MFDIHRSDAAKMLRRVRERLDMTQKAAASLMEISPSLLARKERGEASVERTDVRHAIEVYNLAPWEAYELWLAAGFVPEKTLVPISDQGVYSLAADLLDGMIYPASITDAVGYIRAWNSPYEAIAQVDPLLQELSKADGNDDPQVHMIDLLFSAHARACLEHAWEVFVDQALERFYRQTIQIANEPFFPSLIKRLTDQYGSEFIRQWNRVQTYAPPVEGAEHHQHHIVIAHAPEVGSIDYLILYSEFPYSPALELNVYMPLGEENRYRYEVLRQTIGNSLIHLV